MQLKQVLSRSLKCGDFSQNPKVTFFKSRKTSEICEFGNLNNFAKNIVKFGEANIF